MQEYLRSRCARIQHGHFQKQVSFRLATLPGVTSTDAEGNLFQYICKWQSKSKSLEENNYQHTVNNQES